jgi:hypothetical protein
MKLAFGLAGTTVWYLECYSIGSSSPVLVINEGSSDNIGAEETEEVECSGCQIRLSHHTFGNFVASAACSDS